MSLAPLDWFVLIGTIAAIVGYGAWRSRKVRDAETYLRGDGSLRWPTIGLGIMATQASAITFLSTPSQGFADGMRFVQFYFGLPLAMIVIAAVFVPVYYRLKVRTAYEYLEHRFDVRVRVFGGLLFLIGRGVGTGITIYAPAIILSQILGWPLQTTIWGIGGIVILYTVVGGNYAVSLTQKHQMVVMLTGLAIAAIVVIAKLPPDVSVGDAVRIAGALHRMDIVSFDLDLESRYNFWSGLTGGFFLALSYFGTDQSQVQRYLSGASVAESRVGLLFNGILKVPMQFLILFTGVMVFVFYIFVRPPVHFDAPTLAHVEAARPAEVAALEERFDAALADQRAAALAYTKASDHETRQRLRDAAERVDKVRADAKKLVREVAPDAAATDTDYVFLTFIITHIPVGLVGILMAVILCAAMSAVSSGLISLGTTTTVDFYLRIRTALGKPRGSPEHDLRVGKLATIAWGLAVLGFASAASLFENLIQAVNILGSIFYGTILGLFVVAFFLPRVTATPALVGAVVSQTAIIVLFYVSKVAFLWFNVIGCAIVVAVSLLIQAILRPTATTPRPGREAADKEV